MKVKIKKKSKTKKYSVINSWSEVTLEKWVKLANLKWLTNSEESLEWVKMLSDIPEKLIKELSIPALSVILNRLSELQAKRSGELKRVIEVDGRHYGFHPNLEDLTLGGITGDTTGLSTALYKDGGLVTLFREKR